MTNYKEMFEKQGRLYIYDISYKLLTVATTPINAQVAINDGITTEIFDEGKKLKAIFERKVSFSPESLYELKVAYAAEYTFKSDFTESNDVYSIDFTAILCRNDNKLFNNIVARTSLLISQINSSHGGQPLITPPFFNPTHQ